MNYVANNSGEGNLFNFSTKEVTMTPRVAPALCPEDLNFAKNSFTPSLEPNSQCMLRIKMDGLSNVGGSGPNTTSKDENKKTFGDWTNEWEKLFSERNVFEDVCEECSQSGKNCLCLVNPLFVFHCEFSQLRGPRLWGYVRDVDRKRNNYNELNFPNMFLLGSGYKKYFEAFPYLVTPENTYTEMKDKKYSLNLEKADREIEPMWDAKRNKKSRKNQNPFLYS